ncbi:MAG: ABC transporter substrate-binding protein [Bacteroidota bacterium]
MNSRFFLYLLLVVCFCTCRNEPAADTPPETDESQLPLASKVPFKNTDNVLRVGMRVEPPGLNPVLSTQAASRYVGEMIFQTLNSKDPQTFAQVPLLASVADISQEADGTVSYAYLLDERATWPNGLPVTVADVIFSLKIVLNPLVRSGAYRSYYEFISKVITNPSNERRFKIMTKRPYLLAEQSIGSLNIYPEYAYDPEGKMRNISLGDLTDNATAKRLAENNADLQAFAEAFSTPERAHDPELIVGSGPYQLTSWEDGQRLTLDRRDDYWAPKSDDPWMAAKAERIVFQFIPDEGTMGNALRDELIDVVLDLGVEPFKEFRQEDYLKERYAFSTVPSIKYFGLLLNQDNPLLLDAPTRRALAHLVNVDEMMETIFPGGLAERAYGPVLSSKSYFNADLPPINYDPDRAATLLAEAGWADTNNDGILDKEIDGTRQEFTFELLIFSPSEAGETVAALTSESFASAGIDVTTVRKDGRSLYGAMNKGEYAMSLAGFGFDPNPDDFTQTWASTSVPPNGTNRTGFKNAEADRLMQQIRATLDDKARLPLYRRFQEIIYENQPMIFLFSPRDRIVVSRRFSYEGTSLSPNVDLNAITQESWNKD